MSKTFDNAQAFMDEYLPGSFTNLNTRVECPYCHCVQAQKTTHVMICEEEDCKETFHVMAVEAFKTKKT